MNFSKAVSQTVFENVGQKPLTLFRMGGRESPPPSQFFPVTSTNVRITSQNFLSSSFNPFATLVENFKVAPSASPKLLN